MAYVIGGAFVALFFMAAYADITIRRETAKAETPPTQCACNGQGDCFICDEAN